MNDLDFSRISASVDLLDLVERYTVLNSGGNGPCPLCGGRDRFFINRGGRTFGCRKCNFRGDAIDLVAGAERVTSIEAARMLTGTMPERKPVLTHQDEHEACWKDDEWQTKAAAEAQKAYDYLRSPDWGGDGRFYLESRGLHLDVCLAYGVGFLPRKFDPIDKSKRPCIVIPWRSPDGRITAMKYRFADELGKTDRKRRFLQMRGSDPIVFGIEQCTGGEILVGTEGDMNALALRSAMTEDENVDIVSFGSEANKRGLLYFAKRAQDYAVRVAWLDDPARIDDARRFLPDDTVLIASPKGMDANDLLLRSYIGAGGLRQFVFDRIEQHFAGIGSGP